MNRIIQAFSWRIARVNQHYRKIYWNIKRFLDFSRKERIEAISVVVVGRNDNYGGDFSKRLQTTLDWNLAHLPNPELIYVEWNQIKEQPSDCEWIVKRYSNAKCYIVPQEIHNKISALPDRMPVMEYFAKNLGIRRASHDWILVINADVFLGEDTIRNIKYLNKNYVYGTHYVSIKWDKEPIQQKHCRDKNIIVTTFAATSNLGSVAGNLLLTNRENWLKATGYDETLVNVRAGVDENGFKQLLSLGLKPMILGHHFHLDHPESIIHGINPTHGTHSFNNIPYRNPDTWGLINYPMEQIAERIWKLKLI